MSTQGGTTTTVKRKSSEPDSPLKRKCGDSDFKPGSSSSPAPPADEAMAACDVVERELAKVASRFGHLSDAAVTGIDEQIAVLTGLQAKLLLRPDDEINPEDVKLITEVIGGVRDCAGGIASAHREQHATVSKVGKAIDKNFTPDFGSVTRDDGLGRGERDKAWMTEVICQHLYRHGLDSIGDNLCKEAGLSLNPKIKEHLVELHEISEALKVRNLAPALKWVGEHRHALLEQGSPLEFKLHRLVFLNFVKDDRSEEALFFAQAHFPRFAKRHEKEIQVLMGSLLFHSGGDNLKFRYAKLFDNNTLWEDVQETFSLDACAALGLPVESPLAVCLSAGCTALPALLNISQVLEARQVANIWSGCEKDELPIEIKLGKEFQYHSIFACPILREQASESNPPMRLTCGHVISRDALHKYALGNKLKCPYCPGVQNLNDARQITF